MIFKKIKLKCLYCSIVVFFLHNKVDHTYGFIMIARKKCFIHWENGLTFGFRQCKRVGHLIRELLLQKLQCKYIHLSRGQKYSFAYKAKMKVKFLSGWQKFIDLLSNNFAKCFSFTQGLRFQNIILQNSIPAWR